MAYLGRFRQGDNVNLVCTTKNAGGVPTLSSDCPWAKVWDPTGGLVARFQVPIVDRYVQTAVFQHLLRLGPAYANLGNYRINYHYVVGTYHGLDEDTFELVAGGHPDGTVNAIYFFQKPWARFLVFSLDSGNLAFGRNPRLQ
jgi:hypothetical protein